DRVVIELKRATEARLSVMRAALRESLSTGNIDPAAIYFFRLVKDPEASDLLAALLGRLEINPLVLEAVAHQGRPADADGLERAAAGATLPRDQRLADLARTLAQKLRQSDPCR